MITPYILHKSRILKYIFRDIVQDVDGYYYWWPTLTRGSLSSSDLKMIAKLLDEANRLWDKEIQKEQARSQWKKERTCFALLISSPPAG